MDGEGSIFIAHVRYRNRYHVELHVTNTCYAAVEKCSEIWGCGNINNKGQKTRVSKKWATCYEWRATHLNAHLILKEILPYMVIKKSQALIAIEFAEKHNVRRAKVMPVDDYNRESQQYKTAIESLHHIQPHQAMLPGLRA